ncbi:putative protein-serine/threonine phosphatase [Helianthus debilis subsp. tardiflorus]
MNRLLQEMAKNIVRHESELPANRSRVWLSSDSYKILRKKQGSETLEGLALDMKMLSEENIAFKSTNLRTDALNNMDRLKFLQLNFVELDGSYENFSEDLRWLCWLGFHLRTIPPNLYMGKLVAIDMSYSKLEVFEPPMVLTSLRILNLKDSHNLTEIRNISRIPYLETLILWNCYSLVKVSNTIGDLRRLALLNMTGCSALGDLTIPTFTFPSSLQRLFLKDCRLDCTDSFPLSFSVQLDLQYLNLANSVFESLPCYNHLEKLQVLDLSFCSRLKCLLCLPNSLVELYIYGCESLERITFQSPRFTLQEFGYLGCNCLYEVEGFFKLVPIAELDETDLGHMKWLQQYQYHEVCLVGDDEVTIGRSWLIQMLYEFDIMSTSLPDIKDPNMTPEYTSKSSSLSFDVPSCAKDKWLKGINVTFKYAILDDECAWFCKISTTNGDGDLMYNPKVFGKPEFGKVCIWLSYWPIGYNLKTGDTVNVSIDVLCGLEVHECGVSLVYSYKETLENNMECAEILGGDLSAFHLTTGAYYLCRRDFFELAEVGRLAPDWFKILVGDTIDYTEVKGWRKTGRPKQVNLSSIEVKTIRCIIHGPQLEDIYSMAEMSKSAFTSSLFEGETKSLTKKQGETIIVAKSQSKGIKNVFEPNYIPLWGSHSVCGHRSEMEDAIAVVPYFMEVPTKMFVGDYVINEVSSSLTNQTTHFFGVYDGHGGSQVANYCRDRVHLALEEELKVFSEGIFEGPMKVQWEKVFTKCFKMVDDEVGGRIATPEILNITTEPVSPEIVGSTAVVALICSSHIIVANCGDSRAVLYRGKEVVVLSNDHKPNREDEYARIEAAGGKIIQWNGHRVFGILALSRSIGDEFLKPFIIPDPEVTCTPRAREDECLILASDGLWNVMSTEEVCEIARKRILFWHKKNGGNAASREPANGVDPAAQAAADHLAILALQKGSEDNISVIVVDLKSSRKFKTKS